MSHYCIVVKMCLIVMTIMSQIITMNKCASAFFKIWCAACFCEMIRTHISLTHALKGLILISCRNSIMNIITLLSGRLDLMSIVSVSCTICSLWAVRRCARHIWTCFWLVQGFKRLLATALPNLHCTNSVIIDTEWHQSQLSTAEYISEQCVCFLQLSIQWGLQSGKAVHEHSMSRLVRPNPHVRLGQRPAHKGETITNVNTWIPCDRFRSFILCLSLFLPCQIVR